MQAANNKVQETASAQEQQPATSGAQGEEQKSFAERMATTERKNVDTRVKTEDVIGTTGLTFRDFNLADSVQFVSTSYKKDGTLVI